VPLTCCVPFLSRNGRRRGGEPVAGEAKVRALYPLSFVIFPFLTCFNRSAYVGSASGRRLPVSCLFECRRAPQVLYYQSQNA
jgi:hypothetical protein